MPGIIVAAYPPAVLLWCRGLPFVHELTLGAKEAEGDEDVES